jgi:hypothetical protein
MSDDKNKQAVRAANAIGTSILITIVAVVTWLCNYGHVSLAFCFIWALILHPLYELGKYALVIHRERKQATR